VTSAAWLRARRSRCVTAVSAAILVVSAVVSAEPVCPLRIEPEGSPDWSAAARNADQLLATRGTVQNDCARVVVQVQPAGGAVLHFTTTSGRTASRELRTPDELVPALEALLVTLQPLAEMPPPAASTPGPAVTSAALPPPAPAPAPRRDRFVVGGGAGARLTLPRKYLAPEAFLRASVVLERLELGLVGAWDPLHVRLDGKVPQDFSMSTVQASALCAGRLPAGNTELNLGMLFGVAAVSASAHDLPRLGRTRSLDVAEARLGAVAGIRYPRDSRTRASLDLMGDGAISGVHRAKTAELELPASPRFSVALCLGVETVML